MELLELAYERGLAVMVAEVRHVRPPAVGRPFPVCFVRQVTQELLDSVLGSASVSACMQPRPPGVEPVVGPMEPDADPLAARARPAVEDREMA